VALGKTRGLLRVGARVRVVAEDWRADFEALDGAGIERTQRRFRPSDLDGMFVVMAATGRRAVEETIAREAARRGVLCNVADVPELCDFYLPATLRRGALSVAVSTDGKVPLLSVALRDRLAAWLTDDLEEVVSLLARAREQVRRQHPRSLRERTRALGDLLTPRALDWILAGRRAAFEEHLESWESRTLR
jgi:precorrin-2 dehydrogenase/sirohydrochlorin ferrochelatase